MNLHAALLAPLMLLATLAHAAPDEELLGKSRGYPVGTRMNWFTSEAVRVGSFSRLDTLWPHNILHKADTPLPLPRATAAPSLRYAFEGRNYTIDDYLAHQRTTGLLVIKDGEILVERYQYDRKETDRFVSNSMAKSITSLAVGFALEEGKIRSLDDRLADYIPALTGYAFGDTTIRNLLRMASGVRCIEDYTDPKGMGDLFKASHLLSTRGALPMLQAFNERDAEQGTRFYYTSINTQALGLLVHTVTGKSLSDYITEKLWRPMGAESDASWLVAPDGVEKTAGNFNAILRDYGRLGVLLANDGKRDGKQILPRDYLLEATDWHRHPAQFAPRKATGWFGYGYQFWTFPGEKRRFALLGVYGQAIYIDPELKLVLVHTAAARNASIGKESMGPELMAVWTALVNQYGRW